MPKMIGRLLSCAAIACAATLPQAQAAVIDFEGIAPTILFAGDSVDQAGFRITAGGSFGTVDNAVALGDLAPTGNASQFYSGFNDTFVTISRPDGVLFKLNTFDAAFIPPVVQDAGVDPGAINLRVTAGDGSVRLYFGEFSPSAADGTFPFATYDAGGLLIKSVDFYACTFDAGLCANPNANLGQFALDNINAVAVPEPATYALMALGLLGLALRQRQGR